MKFYFWLLLLIFMSQNSWSQDSVKNKPYFYYPKSFNSLQYSTVIGISVTKFPIPIVEDQVNTAPMLNLDFRLGVSKKIDINFQFYSNYFANLGSLGFQWMLLDKRISLAVGENTAVWFGHLELESIQLKSMGVVISPFFSIGYDAKDFKVTSSLEIQNSYMKTLSHGVLLGEFYRPLSAISYKFFLEQPLWNEHWVVLGIKLNYAKFYYQSWLAYSSIDEYFFYPEFSVGFIL